MTGGLFFEGVGGGERLTDVEFERPFLDAMRSGLTNEPSKGRAAIGELDVDRVGRWAVVAGPVDDVHEGHPGTAVYLFRRVLQAWTPVSGSAGAWLPSWVRRSTGPAVVSHASGESGGVWYLAVDVRDDVASLLVDAPDRTREVDVRGGPGIVAVLYNPGAGTSVSARDSKGMVVESHLVDTLH